MFQQLTYEWEGRSYVLPPDRVLRTIAAVEEVLTLGQLHNYQRQGTLPMAKLAQAFGIMLRAAGAMVTDEQVYNGMFGEGKATDVRDRMLAATVSLQMLMIPPERLKHFKAQQGNKQATRTRKRAGSSPSSTKPSSVTNG